MDKFLKLFGLQKIPKQKTLKEIQREECEHEWEEVNYRGYEKLIYCPKCDYKKLIVSTQVNEWIKPSQLRKQYLESIQFDALDERIKQLEMKERIDQ